VPRPRLGRCSRVWLAEVDVLCMARVLSDVHWARKNPLSALTLAWEASWLASAVSLPAVVMETSFRGLVTAAGTTLACPWPRAAGVRL
jgi:hypothetical protein